MKAKKASPSAIAVGIVVAYAIYLLIVFAIAGVDYDEIAASTGNLVKAVLIPIGIGAFGLAFLGGRLGWSREAMSERPSGPRWMLAIPALIALSALITTANAGFSGLDAGFLIVLVVSVLFVGFSEELLTRGLALVGFRRGGRPEVQVWLFTSLLFGLIHGLNLITGQGLGDTAVQIGFAFVFGSVLYVVRRATGLLVVCMLLHAFWDFSVFLSDGEGGAATTGSASGIAGVISYVAVIIAAIALFKFFRRGGGSERRSPRREPRVA